MSTKTSKHVPLWFFSSRTPKNISSLPTNCLFPSHVSGQRWFPIAQYIDRFFSLIWFSLNILFQRVLNSKMGNLFSYPDSRIVETSYGKVQGRRLIYKGDKQVDAFQVGIFYSLIIIDHIFREFHSRSLQLGNWDSKYVSLSCFFRMSY